MNKKLYRSRKNKIIGGVCGGLGEYFEIDPVLIRVLFVFLAFFHGSGLILYILLLVIIPQEPIVLYDDLDQSKDEDKNLQESEELEMHAPKRDTKKVFGIILLALGTILLLNNLIPFFDFEIIIPLILIFIGLYLVFESFKKTRGQL